MTSPLVRSEGTLRPMLWLVWPVLIEHLLHVLVMLVDLWLAGHFVEGADSLAAIGLLGYVMWMVFTLFSVVAVGATAMTARFVGAGDLRTAAHATNQSLVLGTLMAAGLLVVTLPAVDSFVSALQLEGEAHRLAVRYLLIVLPVLPAIMIEEVGIACLRGAGDMVSGLVVMSLVNLVNIVVGAGLLLGIGPLPRLGWDGLAWGTACGHAVGGLIVLGLLVRGRAGLRLQWGMLRPCRDLMGRLLRVGIPGGVDSILVVACHWWFLGIVNGLGTLSAAAHGIGVRIEALAYMPGAAFQMAAATLAGQYLGARDPRRARDSVLLAVAVGGGIMCAAGATFLLASHELAAFFVADPQAEVVPIAARLVRIVAYTQPAMAALIIFSGGLRGAGDTRLPLVITLVGFLAVRIPLAYYLACDSIGLPWGATIPGLGLGVAGAWYAMVVDVVVRCLLVVGRFFQGGWREIRV